MFSRIKTYLAIVALSISFARAEEIALPPLPYEKTALEPYISAKTLELHHEKHQGGYVEKVNKLAKERGMEGKTLEEIIQVSAQDESLKDLFNAAAQVWNHTFYWNSMKKSGGGEPAAELMDKIRQQFGSFKEFREKFIEAGTKVFGSGWVWLVVENDVLKIVTTSNADLPLIHNQKPLLVCDVWEHTYYLDHQNRRQEYVELFIDKLVNWEFASINMKK